MLFKQPSSTTLTSGPSTATIVRLRETYVNEADARYPPGFQASWFASILTDSFYIYAKALNKTIEQVGPSGVRNGTLLATNSAGQYTGKPFDITRKVFLNAAMNPQQYRQSRCLHQICAISRPQTCSVRSRYQLFRLASCFEPTHMDLHTYVVSLLPMYAFRALHSK